MSEPSSPAPGAPAAPNRGIADVAAESGEQSVRDEREAVGDAPDTGGLVPPDDAQ